MIQARPSETFGHPSGLFTLFLTEMWERFSYYGMRALLIYYLTQHFAFSDADSTELYGAYTTLVWTFTIGGGFLADRFLGQWRSVTLGGTLILCGHLCLASEGALGPPSPAFHQLFFLGLGLIIAGTGIFKPSVSTLVGALYAPEDPRRQSGFFIFYLGINLGAALAAIVCGYLGQALGWSYGFGAAALGMAFGLGVLNRGRRQIEPFAPAAHRSTSRRRAVALALGAVLLAWMLVQRPSAVGFVLGAVLLGGLFVLGRFMLLEATPVERGHLWAVFAALIGVTIFWSIIEQAGSSISLFTERGVDLHLLGIELEPSQTQSFDSIVILLFTPVVTIMLAWLARHDLEPSVSWKYAIGLALAGLGTYALIVGIDLAPGMKSGLQWLILCYFLRTIGELLISPVGLCLMTQLAPRKFAGLIMGIWFYGSAAGNYLAAEIATLTARPEGAGAAADFSQEMARYSAVFWDVTLYAFAAAFGFALISRWLDRQARLTSLQK